MNATTDRPQIKLTKENAEMLKGMAGDSMRSITAEANLLLSKFKGSSHDRRKALRKWDKIRANKAEKSQEWVRSNKQ